jgi:hypothetical protein
LAQNTDVTLFFTAGPKATAVDVARAAKIPGIVRFRNVEEDDGQVEASDYVTAASQVTIPTQYVAVPRRSPEKPVSLTIVPDALSLDLSDVEHGDLRAMAVFEDGTETDVTTSCAWTSATGAVATVGAATGVVTPIGTGTSVITAAYGFAAPGETGVAYASRILTISTAVPTADETVVVGGVTYTWKAAPGATANAVKIGATIAECCRNLAEAINANFKGSDHFGTATVPNPLVSAVYSATTVTATARLPGTSGNAIGSTETGANTAWAGTTLTGGANATTPVSDTTTVTVVA